MTLLDAPPAPSAPFTGPAARPRRGRRITAAITVLVLIAGGVVGGFAIKDAVALSQVHVFLDAKPFTCTSPSSVTTIRSPDGPLIPAVRLAPGLDCRMTVLVQNRSDTDLAVERVTYPLFGGHNGWGVRTDLMLQQGVEGTSDGPDAIFDFVQDPDNRMPYPIGAGATERLVVHLTWTPTCVADGGSGIFTEAPVLRGRIGLVEADRAGEGNGYGVVGTPAANALCT